jgi:hypothetical protein
MRHTFITGFVYESKACLNCHPTGGDAAISLRDHSAKFFPIETGKHADLTCASCHNNPADASSITCLSCHAHSLEVAATRHENVTGYVYSTASCMNCHPKGAEAPISDGDHSVKFFPIMTGDHAGLACKDCHTDPTQSDTFVCTTCHTQEVSARQHAATTDYVWTDAGCFGCHPRG